MGAVKAKSRKTNLTIIQINSYLNWIKQLGESLQQKTLKVSRETMQEELTFLFKAGWYEGV